MTQPGWYPASNPGGANRATTRKALVQWIAAQRIPGLKTVYGSRAAQLRFDDNPGGPADFAALVKIATYDDSEDREAMTGPADAGGKLVHYAVGLRVCHRSYNPDDNQTDEAEDDYDRVIDAIKDCLRGVGRDLGRPDVVLMVGEWPRARGIVVRNDPPLLADGGVVERNGMMSFTISQYIASNT